MKTAKLYFFLYMTDLCLSVCLFVCLYLSVCLSLSSPLSLPPSLSIYITHTHIEEESWMYFVSHALQLFCEIKCRI